MRDLRRQAQGRALFSLMLAATLFMRMLVPAGWMPVADASGLHIRHCSGWASQPRHEPAVHDHRHHHDNHAPAEKQEGGHSGQPCAFAGLGMAFLYAPDQPSIAALPFAALAPEKLRHGVPTHGLAAPPPPATGPPSIA